MSGAALAAGELMFLDAAAFGGALREQGRKLAVALARLGSDGMCRATLLFEGPPAIVTRVRFHSVASPPESVAYHRIRESSNRLATVAKSQ